MDNKQVYEDGLQYEDWRCKENLGINVRIKIFLI